MSSRWIALALIAISLAAPVRAHDDSQDPNILMFDRETYFQPADAPAEDFHLQDTVGNEVSLASYAGKVVVLNFIYASCPDLCPLHTEKLRDLQNAIGASAMKDLVTFVSITTDPASDTAAVLRNYADAHGLDTGSWDLLAPLAGEPESSTRALAERYGLKFTPTGELQSHGAVTYVIDADGHLTGKFHGLDWETANAAIYINSLINAGYHQDAGGWLDPLKRLLQ